MRQHGLIHPRLLAELEGVGPGLTQTFYPSDCTINSVTIVINSFGEEIVTEVEVLVDVPCRLAPSSSKEILGAQQEFVEALSHVSLAGYYPEIDSDMIPVIDGKPYEMYGEPEHDGNHKLTRFYVKEVE